MILKTTGRTLNDGTWTPTIVTVTGTDITIRGYTQSDDTGYISVDGSVSNLVIDTENRTAFMDGENVEHLISWRDYGLWVGPGETYFEIEGADNISIQYHNRWL